MSAPTRTNPHTGRPCPDWCQSDHAERFQVACVGSSTAGLRMELGNVWARAMITPDGPRVCVNGTACDDPHRSAYVETEPQHAEQLATLMELLAEATAEQHRMLAAGIRRAAADLDGQGA